jgi:hypothetical protein
LRDEQCCTPPLLRPRNEKQSKPITWVAMADNFLACDRDQALFLPPDLRDWLPADHLAWFVLEAVAHLELGSAAYRADGHSCAAYDPKMLPGVALYAYCTEIRSWRRTERRCHEAIASVFWPPIPSRLCDRRSVPPASIEWTRSVACGRDGPRRTARPRSSSWSAVCWMPSRSARVAASSRPALAIAWVSSKEMSSCRGCRRIPIENCP